jgi:hypothetical protein
MTQDINAAVTYLQTICAGIAGMRQAPAAPTEQGQFPFAVSYVSGLNSSTQRSHGSQTNLYEITTEIHVARKDLPRDYASISAFAVLFPSALWGDLNSNSRALGGHVSTINDLSGSLQPSNWGGVDTLAWTFRIGVKVMSQWTT